ncbi:MAG TPA: ribbon-helix-helix protein, CopG family [Bdellovibrionota bacterium]|nr:ribbon-helix-helix protein, CopG family [Bdellovibrionota bacterium]
MKYKAQTITFSLPHEMSKLIMQLAKSEHRTISELIREALRQYSSMKTLLEVHKRAKKIAKKRGLAPADVERVIDEGRK